MIHSTLSERQQKVLDAIISYIKTNHLPPTTREIQKLSGLSPRGVTLQLDFLEKHEFIKRKPGARGISVNSALLNTTQDETISINVVPTATEQETIVNIPMMSASISAGLGNYAEDHIEGQIPVALSATRGLRNVFAVKVSGDSMIDAGIESGDIAIIASQPMANDGDIVAAYYSEGVTLKRYRTIESREILMPANKNYAPIVSKFFIQGKLINVIKSGNR